MARLSFRCSDDLLVAVDRARGDVARERWLRRAVERALEEPSAPGMASCSAETPAPAERPELVTTPEVVRRYEATMAREFRPYPKGGK